MDVKMTIDADAAMAEMQRLIDVFANVEAVLLKQTEIIADRARVLCPYRTGVLQRSIATDHPEQYVTTITAGEGLPDKRAIYMEYGTPTISPRSYMRPAVEEHRAGFSQAIEDAFAGKTEPP